MGPTLPGTPDIRVFLVGALLEKRKDISALTAASA
jgi:hypothetical protein